MARRNRGIVLLIIGVFLILTAGGWYIYNIIEDINAGKQAEMLLNNLKNTNIDTENENFLITVDGDAFLGRIKIEKINLELPVYAEWNYTRLKFAPCRYTGSIEENNMIISGHNYQTHFGPISRLETGDEVKFIDAFQKEYVYEVKETEVLQSIAVSDMQAGDWDLTLFTCTKDTERRITVRCEKAD